MLTRRSLLFLLFAWVSWDFATPVVESPFVSRVAEYEDREEADDSVEAVRARRPRHDMARLPTAPPPGSPRVELAAAPVAVARPVPPARPPREWRLPSRRAAQPASDPPASPDDH